MYYGSKISVQALPCGTDGYERYRGTDGCYEQDLCRAVDCRPAT